jgi:hypothetical protein
VSDVRQPGGETTRKEERTMTVAELIDRLERCDPEATVRIMMQESWPFENSILGIAVRSDFADECECDRRGGEHEEGCPANDDDYGDPELARGASPARQPLLRSFNADDGRLQLLVRSLSAIALRGQRA